MELLEDSGLIVPFQSHYVFSACLSQYVAAILHAYTGGRWDVVRTGAASLSFIPDVEFSRSVYSAASSQMLASGHTPGKWVICVYPDVHETGMLLRAFPFSPTEKRACGERIDFLREADDVSGPLTFVQQLIKFVPLPTTKDDLNGQFEKLIRLANEGREELWLLIGMHSLGLSGGMF